MTTSGGYVPGEANRIVVRPEKNLAGSFVQEFRAKIKESIDKGVKEVVIDLEGVQMVDSTGIGLLVSTHNSLSKRGGRLEVIHVSGDLLELFQWMRLHQHFSISGAVGKEAVSS